MENIIQKGLYMYIYEEYIIKNNKVYEILEKINSDEHLITLEILGKKFDSITFVYFWKIR